MNRILVLVKKMMFGMKILNNTSMTKNIVLLGETCKGASHVISGKPCQDYSIHEDFGIGQLLIVSDGHGSDEYFRSDKGAKIAVAVTRTAVLNFVQNFEALTKVPPFKQRGITGITDEKNEDFTLPDVEYEEIFRHLFKYIISQWHEQISNDWVSYPPTDEEYSKADQNSGRVKALYEIEQPNLSRAYGCTLICAVRTSEFWFAFHLGDGKCIAFNDDGSWFEPIPWDSRCFLNKTTSLSGQGYESFRYCYGTRQVPALFIGSDGMDDSYPPISCLADWYKLILYKILEHDSTKVQDMIVDFLPKLSKQGSKDDMSLQLWVDMDSLSTLCHNIYNKDINEKEQYCEQLSNEISNLKTDIFICSNNIDECNKEQIKLSEEKNKKKSFVESLVNAIHYLKKQLTQKEQQLSAENKELSALENNILVVSQKLSKLNSELEHTKKEIDRKEKEQNKTKDEIDTLKKLMSNINEKVNDHKCDIKYTI